MDSPGTTDIEPDTVVLVQIVMRHGEKGCDVVENGQITFSTLTERGRRQMQMLGVFVRQRYNTILGGELDEITARSSRIPRCVDSAVQFIKGVCPKLQTKETLSEHVYTEPLMTDHMLYPLSHYPEAEEEVLKLAQTDRNFRERHVETISYLGQTKANTIMDLLFLREKVRYARLSRSPMPESITEDMGRKIEQMAAEVPVVYNNSEKFKLIRVSKWVVLFKPFIAYSRQMDLQGHVEAKGHVKLLIALVNSLNYCCSQHLCVESLDSGQILSTRTPNNSIQQLNAHSYYSGSLLRNLLDNMTTRQQGNSNKRLHLLVTHDIHLIYFALALNVYDEVAPGYGESYIFELHCLNSEYMVVIYRIRPEFEKGLAPLVKVYPTDEKYRPLDLFKADFKPYFDYNLKQIDTEPSVGDSKWHGRMPLWL